MTPPPSPFTSEVILEPEANHPTHQLYAADNLMFLEAIQVSTKNTIDVCYLDPPYNTGGTDRTGFTYHDSFKVSGDGNRHTSWLAFIEARLRLLKPLLKETGVVAISIDDREVHRLRVLCDTIFGESNFVAQIIVDGGAVKNNAKLISVSHEYLLVYAKSTTKLLASGVKWRTKREGIDLLRSKELTLRKAHDDDYAAMTSDLKAWMKTAPLSKRLKVFFNVDANGLYTYADLTAPNSTHRYTFPHPKTGKEISAPSRGWLHAKDKIMDLMEKNMILFGPDEKTQPLKKLYLKDGKDQVVRSVWGYPSRSSTHLLEKMLGRRSSFNNPKNMDLMIHIVDIMCPADGTVLDFFAGSGTTGHAVVKLNTVGANRKFILCTNNENNIFDEVTKPRLVAAISGVWGNGSKHKKTDDGLTLFTTV